MNRAMNRFTILVIAFAAAPRRSRRTGWLYRLSNPSQPATVKAHLIFGSITVTAGSGSEVVVEIPEGPGTARTANG